MPQISYAKVATDENGNESAFSSPPMMRRPVVWIGILICAIGAGVALTSSSHRAVLADEAADMEIPTAEVYASPETTTTTTSYQRDDSLLSSALSENAQLRARLEKLEQQTYAAPAPVVETPVARPVTPPVTTTTPPVTTTTTTAPEPTTTTTKNNVDDPAFSALFEENSRLREQLSQQKASEPTTAAAATGGADFDIAAYREQALAATPPNIIECAEAGEGGSQEACHLPRDRRFEALGQKGVTLWMTGLSGSGKSTIARALEEELVLKYGKHVQQLDGDNVRTGLNRDLGFSPADRKESVRRVSEMACLFNGGGVITLVTLVSPYRADRDEARKRHEDQNLNFLEVFMNVNLDTVQERDPKGLYAKVAAGEITGFTGVDAPYEAPLTPEIDLPNSEMSIEECVAALIDRLQKEGVLEGGPTDPSGLPLPPGYAKGWLEDELILTGAEAARAKEDAAKLSAKVRLTDIDVNWLHVISEGWAAPLSGFLREGPLLQALHFNSIMIDPFDDQGAKDLIYTTTDWNDYETRGSTRTSLSVPIVLPITAYTKAAIDASADKAVALHDKDGRLLGVLRDPEVYVNRQEEIVTRCFGAIDPEHPYIKHLYAPGMDYLLGGEIQIFEKIAYDDGLDKWRLTPKELFNEFKAKEADVVFAFQTRNPTHAGHAYLMRTGRERLLAKGYKNPVLWLSPLGGWTKSDDVPLDVRVKQHQAVLDEKMLDPSWTVMGIWPAPMIYAGPTEVQFHALSRKAAGAAYFVVGRDAAGIKGSTEAVWNPDDDMYDANHARYVLQMSPVLEDKKMSLLSFDKFYYDKSDHTMKAMDESRPDDFISISGSKMRALARQGATPCEDPIPSDLLAANCVPQGFMVPSGWAIVCDYYQNIDDADRWVPWSKSVVDPSEWTSTSTVAHGAYGTKDYALFLTIDGKQASPWHDVPLMAAASSTRTGVYNFVTEIPMYTSAKMEVTKDKWYNPIQQDSNKDGSPRYYTYGTPFFNYGLLPQTWEDPDVKTPEGYGGDDDPLDVIELGDDPLTMGSVTEVVVVGSLELIDEGETDHKILAIRSTDPRASERYDSPDDLERHFPGVVDKLVDWLKMYKTSDGKPENILANNDLPLSAKDAVAVVDECHSAWQKLTSEGAQHSDFWLGAGL
eukprot:CAMPEP_0118904606 /NCGR_PEP_ID=MMETSP1166-20130328/9000_1 /TAXON_ID=1104430 /ORGANISM="Chrysoreinhardia sp, Strain CCMP3193" /LENGTH=1143 /DNA_ID=CAMNT_0006843863 /DNA_START=17 /DNA_END=3448 /DNA_ORIENTATION=+